MYTDHHIFIAIKSKGLWEKIFQRFLDSLMSLPGTHTPTFNAFPRIYHLAARDSYFEMGKVGRAGLEKYISEPQGRGIFVLTPSLLERALCFMLVCTRQRCRTRTFGILISRGFRAGCSPYFVFRRDGTVCCSNGAESWLWRGEIKQTVCELCFILNGTFIDSVVSWYLLH